MTEEAKTPSEDSTAGNDDDRFEVSTGSTLVADMQAAEAEKAADASKVEDKEEKPAGEEASADTSDEKADAKSDEQAGDDDAAKPEATKPNKVEKRINKLTRQKNDERRAREAAEAEAARLRQELEAAKGGDKKPDAEKRPDRDDFEDYDDYIDALTDWKVDQKLKSEKPAADDDTGHEGSGEVTAEQRELFENIRDVVDESADQYPDFAEKVLQNEELALTQHMVEVIFDPDSENAADIAMYLANNPNVAADIAQKSDLAQTRAIGRIEAQLEAGAISISASSSDNESGQKTKPKKSVSSAPDPITPQSSATTSEMDVTDEQMSLAEFRRRRNASYKKQGLGH